MDFVVPVDYKIKLKESEKRDEYLDLARELKKTREHEGDNDTNCNWFTWNNPQNLGNKKTSRDYPDNSIIKTSQNTEKSAKDLLSLKL